MATDKRRVALLGHLRVGDGQKGTNCEADVLTEPLAHGVRALARFRQREFASQRATNARVRPLAAPAPHEDPVVGCAATAAGDRGAGTRAASDRGEPATGCERRHVGRLRPGLHDPARRSGRPAQLPPGLQAEGREGGRAGRPHSLNSANLRQPPRRPRRSPAGGHGCPPAQQDRSDDGDLLTSLVIVHPRCAQAPWGRTRRLLIRGEPETGRTPVPFSCCSLAQTTVALSTTVSLLVSGWPISLD